MSKASTSSSSSAPCRIYGRWINQEMVVPPDQHTPILVHVYDIPIPPSKPLTVGLRVQLIGLSPTSYHNRDFCHASPHYDTYDPQIEGEVVALKSLGKSVVEYVIKNERPGKVHYAYIAVRYLPGVTAKMGLWETTCHWMFSHDMRDCRPVAYEADARVADNLPASPTPPVRFTYPNPESADTLMVGVRVGRETRGGPKRTPPRDDRGSSTDSLRWPSDTDTDTETDTKTTTRHA
ncbi:hypothetical protein DICSQDRAFT_128544 [Dichomitus squalens LYAD-421 SS1]|uniref:Uncharacterized protein n=1 Tax=Dichomitus squalens (strain LYAD-421) TaxID=732165 RepID=R7SRY2_DICSQ|nr:uncharacterized protein DICSQDRAFT_128544 [Dichomitus squalens LYAD-421 SS1]EJF58959.1 hypothetical protein DICSQDRAFT_128544 [Dichomitus squalens LYAD-421 SS1]